MSDIEHWLQQHDLGKFTKAFVANKIKLGELSELSNEDPYSQVFFSLHRRPYCRGQGKVT